MAASVYKDAYFPLYIGVIQEKGKVPWISAETEGPFVGDEPKSGLPETLATAYNPGMCLLALPVIRASEELHR